MNQFKGIGTYGTIGLDLAVSIGLGLWAGRWADNKLHSSPWMMIVGLLLGVAVGVNLLWKTVRQMQRDIEEEDRQAKAQRNPEKRDDNGPS